MRNTNCLLSSAYVADINGYPERKVNPNNVRDAVRPTGAHKNGNRAGRKINTIYNLYSIRGILRICKVINMQVNEVTS
jgi:hypothetical protein